MEQVLLEVAEHPQEAAQCHPCAQRGAVPAEPLPELPALGAAASPGLAWGRQREPESFPRLGCS